MPETRSKRSVVIYQDGLLAYSETFIKQQILGLTRWQATLVGHRYRRESLDFSMIPSRLLLPAGASLFSRLRYAIHRWYNRPDPAGLATLRSLAPKIIHAHFGTSAVDIWPYAKALGIPLLVTLHGFDISIRREWWESGKRSRRKRRYPAQLERLSREDGVHFLAVSTAIRERALAFGIPPEKITLSYIGVDADRFTPGAVPLPQRPNRIIYVGRLVEKKGSPYLLEAFAKTKSKVPDAELMIVGKGALEERLRERVRELGLNDVVFAGAQSNERVKELIDQSKVFCLPSITASNGDAEGLPISILEAQASGVFVVTSSSGGLGDNLIPGQTCFFFEERNVDQLADQLTELLTHPGHHLHMLDRQRALIDERFDRTRCTAQLELLYDKFALP